MNNRLFQSFRDLRQKGYSNDKIISKLEENGENLSEIFKVVEILDTQRPHNVELRGKKRMEPTNPMNFQPQSMNQNMPPPSMGMPPNDFGNSGSQQDDAGDLTQIEELIEAVIDEKWKEIERNIMKIVSWKDKIEQRISQMEQNLTDLRSDYDGLQKAIIGKVGDYDKNVLEVGTQLKAMEKAFSEVLPQFTRNINDLNRITQRVKSQEE